MSPKIKAAAKAAAHVLVSNEARSLEFALVRLVVYAVLTAFGIHHAGTVGL